MTATNQSNETPGPPASGPQGGAADRSLKRAEYDAIVIGSGPNGMSAAITLAGAGWKVLVIEAGDTPGGGTRTRELTLPGFRHDVCSAVHPTGAASPVFQALKLEQYGLEWVHPEIPLAHPLDGGKAAVLHRSVDATAQGLGPDGRSYRLVFDYLVRNAQALYPDIFTPLKWPAHPLKMKRFGLTAMLPATLAARLFFNSPEGRALLAGNAAHGVIPLSYLMSSAIAVVLQMSAHAVGWPVARGGTQAITRALQRVLEERGGELVCGWRVRSFAELPTARAVLFDTSPRVMMDIMGDELPQRYRQRLAAFRHGPGVFKVDYALSDPVPWSNPFCRGAGTVHVGGTLEEIAASERETFDGKISDKPFVLVAQQSVCDSTRAPAGKHTLWAYCHVPHGSDANMESRIAAQIERFAPGFRDCILATHTMNCAQMEAYNPNYIGGDIGGGIADSRQLLTRPVASLCPYATPNPKIFLCSASTPPAGGVHGMCGWNAAQAVLKRLPL